MIFRYFSHVVGVAIVYANTHLRTYLNQKYGMVLSHFDGFYKTCTEKQQLSLNSMLAQWLSGRVLDSRPKGSGFEPHRRHCVVVLEQDTFILA